MSLPGLTRQSIKPKDGCARLRMTGSNMHRVSSISPAGSWKADQAIDRVTLDADDRMRRRIVLTGEQGTRLLIDFDRPVTLHDGDGLVLETGEIVAVAGLKEKLAEVVASSPREFVRIA